MLTRLTILTVLASAACGDDLAPTVGPDAGTTISDAGASDTTVDLRRSYVYFETNDPGGNAIAVLDRGFDGSIIAGKRHYSTGGVGITAGPLHGPGPLDGTGGLVLSRDHGTLYAVNTGGSTVAVFHTSIDGTLVPLARSPYVVGPNPASLAIANRTMFVVDKAVEGRVAPRIATMTIDDRGELDPSGVTELEYGGSPSIAYLTPDAKYLFGTAFFDGARRPPSGQIYAYTRGDDNTLQPLFGQPFAAPIARGVIAHPMRPTLYVGFPLRAQIGVYTYAADGLDFVGAIAGDGTSFSITRDGRRLYALGSKVATYDLANPEIPVLLGEVDLGCRGSEAALDGAERDLYVLCNDSVHVLTVDGRGTLEEKFPAVDLREVGISSRATPQGIVVFEPALR